MAQQSPISLSIANYYGRHPKRTTLNSVKLWRTIVGAATLFQDCQSHTINAKLCTSVFYSCLRVHNDTPLCTVHTTSTSFVTACKS